MESQKLKCKYVFDPNYNPVYVNGAQGGVTPNKEIVINFYLERNALPNSQTFKITDDKLGEPVEVEPEDLRNSFVRVIENGVVMNYRTAKEIHRWLGNHIKTLEKIEGAHEDRS